MLTAKQKPVSSLRSHFENMLSTNKSPAPTTPRQPSPAAVDCLAMPEDHRKMNGRKSLDIPRENGGRTSTPNLADYSGTGSTTPRGRTPGSPWSNSKPRPTSMVAFSPPRSPTRSPPRVTVQSPKSPPIPSEPHIHSPLPSRTLPPASVDSPTHAQPISNGTKTFKVPSRHATPVLESKHFFPASPVASPSGDPRKSGTFERPAAPASSVPPPINRAGKPKILSKSHSVEPSARTTLAPGHSAEGMAESVSPFSTPPSSSEGSVKEESPSLEPGLSKPRGAAPKESYFPPPPVHHSLVERLPSSDPRAIVGNPPLKFAPQSRANPPSDRPEDRPALPARREKDNVDLRKSMVIQRPLLPEPPIRRSMDTFRPAALVAETNNKFMPPPRRIQATAAAAPTKSLEPPKPPPPRNSGEFKRPNQVPAQASTQTPAQASQPYTYDSDDTDTANEKPTTALTDYPDSSQANRRPPVFQEGTSLIPTGYETKLFAICGEYICTTGYVTNVWNVLNGRLLMSQSHGETVKATSVAFRPAKNVDDEGKRLWLGTNIGEMHELDIPTQSLVHTKSNAHKGSPVLKIFRYASEMWSLDDDGKLHIWLPDETGSPTLQQTPSTFRVPRGHTFSIISGSQLWIAFTKEIRVYNRTVDNNYFQQMTQGSLSQQNVGDVTSGAILSSQPDRIYFGHTDGKITIYAKKNFECLGVINVSLYKISSLVGVGDYLWAGYSTGMIYVYDTSSTPWKVMKDWKAHEKPIAGIIADRTSIWKLDRLQVASLGTDSMLRIWDGMLRNDWLGRIGNPFLDVANKDRNPNAATRR